jgi:DegV family protein with EDD domain
VSPGAETAVVCDSSQYLPPEVISDKGIGVVSLYVSVDDDQERETEITDYDDFYRRLRHSSGGATTSQPSLGDFIAVWQPLLDQGKEVVSIHISSAISGTYEAANQARQRLTEEGKGGERIHLYDSEMACGATGLCVLAAHAAIEAGGGPTEALARAKEVRETLKMWFAVDTLEYLRKGGRIGGASAWIGGALKIKPILTIDREIKPIERVRTRARSLERLRGYARLGHPAHPGPRDGRGAGRRPARDLRRQTGLHLRDRAGDRRPRRPRAPRRRRDLLVAPRNELSTPRWRSSC